MDDIRVTISSSSPRLLDQLRLHMRKNGLAYRTEQTYIHWVKRFIYFHNKQHPKAMGPKQIEDFLIDFSSKNIIVRGGKGNKDRSTLLSVSYYT
jgi:hypothetical protein